ncbi:MAG: rod-binding protein [Bdellovibrionales bacterium]
MIGGNVINVGLIQAAAVSENVVPSGNNEALQKTAKDFEAVFMGQMLKPMWEGLEADSMFGGGAGEEAFRDLLVQEYGKSMAEADGLGLSDMLMHEVLKLQEQAAQTTLN